MADPPRGAEPSYDEFEPDPRKATSSGFSPEEPVFILRAQDVFAPAVVRLWCEMATLLGVEPSKVREARQIALAMEMWPHRKVPD